MKAFWRKHRSKLSILIGYPILSLLMATVRIRHHHRERSVGLEQSQILCGLHARGIMAGFVFKRLAYWVLVSLSRDGEMQNKLYMKLGYRTVRGSTGRGGVKATIEAIRLLKTSREVLVIAVDGPRGPRGIVQEGAILMAKKSGCALMPVGMSCNPRWNLKTWDHYTLPKPFCRCEVVYGEPIFVPANADEATFEAVRKQLQEAIHAAEAEANRLSGYVPFPHQDLDPEAAPCA